VTRESDDVGAGDELILRSARFAQRAHAGQQRKYSHRPFIEHPARVAARVMLLDSITVAAVAAAWLHDVLEDCGYSRDELRHAGFPDATLDLVVELTNVSSARQQLPRARRKQMDRDRLARVSPTAKRIKMVDRVDNLREVNLATRDFQSLYVAETVLLLPCLADADTLLADEVCQAVEELGFPRDHHDTKTVIR
jgi:(p)ppGpp synthase/HD superfamily hydrolase